MTTGFILHRLKGKPRYFYPVLAGVIGSIAFNTGHIVRDVQALNPFAYLSGKQDRQAFLSQHVPAYPIYRFANENLPAQSKLFLIYMRNLGYLCERSYFSDSILESHTLEQILTQSATADQVHRAIKDRGFSHILYDVHFVLGGATPLSDPHQDLFKTFEQLYLEPMADWQGRYRLLRVR
jgi:hypothetical protein